MTHTSATRGAVSISASQARLYVRWNRLEKSPGKLGDQPQPDRLRLVDSGDGILSRESPRCAAVLHMVDTPDQGPDDKDALRTALTEARARRADDRLQLAIAQMKREMFGPRSERSQPLLDQKRAAARGMAAERCEDEAKAGTAGIQVQGFTRKATRRNFPDHLPCRRVVYPAPTCCPYCGGTIKAHVFAAERIHGDETTVPVLAKVKT